MTNHKGRSGPMDQPELPEFRDVTQDDDGTWHAIHIPSGREISADTRADLEHRATVVRVVEDHKKALG